MKTKKTETAAENIENTWAEKIKNDTEKTVVNASKIMETVEGLRNLAGIIEQRMPYFRTIEMLENQCAEYSHKLAIMDHVLKEFGLSDWETMDIETFSSLQVAIGNFRYGDEL